MHVLHVNSGIDPRQGGPTSVMLAMIRAQIAAGLTVAVVSTFGLDFDSSAADQLRSMGAEVTLIGPHGRFLASHSSIKPELRRLIADADVVHIHAVWEDIQHHAASIARQMHKPYLFTLHGMLDAWSLRQGRLKKWVYLSLRLRRDLNGAAALHFTDVSELEQARPLRLQPRTIVEDYVLDLSDFQPPPEPGAFRSKHDALRDRPILLFMSRIHPKKGLDLLVPAFASAAVKEAILVIAGPDEDAYRATVEALAHQHHVANRVLFTGMLRGRERAAALADADVFVLPSYQENFGIVVIEAMAVGTPVITSDQVAVHRLVTQGQAGEVIPTEVPALTAALDRWLGDAALRRSAGENGKQLVASTFDPVVQTQRWIRYYSELR